MIDQAWLAERLMFMIPLILSLSVHEWAHAWSATRLGDDTPRLQGRLTLNPMAHIDPVGTLLLPLLGVPFGWAKPVMINPSRFRLGVNMRTGMMIVALAGPISNVLIAAVCVVLEIVLLRSGMLEVDQMFNVKRLLDMVFVLNLLLAMFNMLPIPPLDGSRVVDALLPQRLRPAWESFSQVAPIALIAVILLPSFLGFSLFDYPLRTAMHWLHWLTVGPLVDAM